MRRLMNTAFVLLWFLLPPGNTVWAQALQATRLLTREVGWAQTTTSLYRTTDAGDHWRNITPEKSRTEYIGGTFFLDTSTGWVILSQADENGQQQFRIASTSDAGSTWSSSSLNLPWKRYAGDFAGGAELFFLDRLHGWVNLAFLHSSSVAPALMLATRDGGKTWAATPGTPGRVGHLCFFGQNDGILAGGAQQIELWVTHDGSKSWHEVALGAPSTIAPANLATYGRPTCSPDKHGSVPVTYSGPDGSSSALVLFNTNDAGKAWKAAQILSHLKETSPGEVVPAAVFDSTLVAAIEAGSSVTLKMLDSNGHMNTKASGKLRQALDIDFVDESHGWALTSDGLFSTKDGGGSWSNVSPHPASSRSGARKVNALESPVLGSTTRMGVVPVQIRTKTSSGPSKDIHLGFDRGQAPSTDQMSTWWNYSPYYDFQISLPGAANHKVNSKLTPGWVSTVQAQGWGLWPVWVGPQAPCVLNPPTVLVVINANTPPYQQGQAEAAKAIAALQSLGNNLTNTIIYYDVENYDTSNTNCVAIVENFLNGWINGLQSSSYKAGIYGNVPSAALNFSQLSPLPDDVWIALGLGPSTAPRTTIWNLSVGNTALCDPYSTNPCSLWSADQRIRQYLIDGAWGIVYTETWGGQTLEIDPDVVDADVAWPSFGVKTYAYAFTSFDPGGNTTYPFSINNIGTANRNYGGFINGSGGGEIGQIVDFWQDWVNGSLFAEGNLLYNPDNQIVTLPPGYPNTGQCGALLYCATYMHGMNNAGTIVGNWGDANFVTHGFVNQGGVYTSIDYPGALHTLATALNDAGIIVGYYQDSSSVIHGFIYNSKTSSFVGLPLDYPGAVLRTVPLGINGDGQIVGLYYDGANNQGFLYINGTFSGIPGTCGPQAIPTSINNNGQIVGYYVNLPQAFITFDLGISCISFNYPGSAATQAFSINDAAQISGSWWAVGSNVPDGFVAVPQTP